MTPLVLAAAGAGGGLFRYLLSGWVQQRSRSVMPLGTAAVNLLGAFLLGMVAGAVGVESAGAAAMVGFTGGLTTFSTWMVETVRMAPQLRLRAAVSVAALLVIGVVLAAAGFHLTD